MLEAHVSPDRAAELVRKYDHLFPKESLICVATVAWKLAQPGHSMLACVGEELALHALVTETEGILKARGAEVDLADLLELATEDADYELLFSMAWDGIEDFDTAREEGMANLAFDDWFKPFRDENPVHPLRGAGLLFVLLILVPVQFGLLS